MILKRTQNRSCNNCIASFINITYYPLLQENITVCGKQGGKLEGNATRKLLKCLDSLELELSKVSQDVYIKGLPFTRALRDFNNVVHSCFGSELGKGWQQHIVNFTNSYLALNSRHDRPISITPKVIFFVKAKVAS